MRRRWMWAALAIAGLVAAALWYALALPGASHTGPLPPFTADETALAARLRRHVEVIASEPHNTTYPKALERAAVAIERHLAGLGYDVERQEYQVDGPKGRQKVRNIFVTIEPAGGAAAAKRTVVVGAHYDSWIETPGANDNGSGTAALMELARAWRDLASPDTRTILVFFVNEEPPYFGTPDMGSVRFADMLAKRGEPVAAMLSLETIGYFSDREGSQNYPAPLGLVFPGKADFVAFVAMPGSRDLMQSLIATFRETTKFPTIGGVAPGFIPGIAWSDHASFADAGFRAVMITDTALFRYEHYHKPTDTPDKLDYQRLARITKGIERAVRRLANAG